MFCEGIPLQYHKNLACPDVKTKAAVKKDKVAE